MTLSKERIAPVDVKGPPALHIVVKEIPRPLPLLLVETHFSMSGASSDNENKVLHPMKKSNRLTFTIKQYSKFQAAGGILSLTGGSETGSWKCSYQNAMFI